MFGYVRPVLNRLSEADRQRYQSAYCGLCHTLGRRHGWLTRFTLNYDFTFLAVLLYGAEGESDSCVRRCPAHPFKKRADCICGRTLNLAADVSMVLLWHKLQDDVDDKSFFGSLPSRGLSLFLKRAYGNAAARCTSFDQRVKENLNRLKRLEEERSPALDRAADTFASILAAAADACGDESRRRVMGQLLYHLGRWIYLVDAWDDLEDDRKQERYNPLDARFSGNARGERDYISTTMSHSLNLLSGAANLIDFGVWSEIVGNVIHYGLPAVQNAVLDGKWKELRSVREKHA